SAGRPGRTQWPGHSGHGPGAHGRCAGCGPGSHGGSQLMRLLVSFAGALLVTLALFALMMIMVMPPRDNRDLGEELARVSFVRSVADTPSDSRQRQPRQPPEQPQPPDVPPPQP